MVDVLLKLAALERQELDFWVTLFHVLCLAESSQKFCHSTLLASFTKNSEIRFKEIHTSEPPCNAAPNSMLLKGELGIAMLDMPFKYNDHLHWFEFQKCARASLSSLRGMR